LNLNHKTFDDESVIFYLPKLNLRISYDSYLKYKVVVVDSEENILHVSSERLGTYKTNLCVTIGNGKIKLYQDGDFIGETEYKKLSSNSSDDFYLGKTFKGLVYNLAIYDTVLSNKQVKEISKNKHFGLTYFKSSSNLKTYYEASFSTENQLIDLSENKNKGEMHGCRVVSCDIETTKSIKVPFKRESTFKMLGHDSNGFENGGWKSINTRYNQLKFNNEVSKGKVNTIEDGLSNLEYKEYSNTKFDNITHIVVDV
jgi:hypothetical protein